MCVGRERWEEEGGKKEEGGGGEGGVEGRGGRGEVVSLLQSKCLHYPMSVQLHLYAPGRNLLLRSCALEGCLIQLLYF